MLERYYTQARDDEPGFLERLEKHLEAAREKAETSGVKMAVRNEFWSVLRGEDRAVLAARNLPDDFTIPRIWRT